MMCYTNVPKAFEDCLRETNKRIKILEAVSINQWTDPDLRSAPGA
jgi:hypothetical protein